jgi:hypothetical protein
MVTKRFSTQDGASFGFFAAIYAYDGLSLFYWKELD